MLDRKVHVCEALVCMHIICYWMSAATLQTAACIIYVITHFTFVLSSIWCEFDCYFSISLVAAAFLSEMKKETKSFSQYNTKSVQYLRDVISEHREIAIIVVKLVCCFFFCSVVGLALRSCIVWINRKCISQKTTLNDYILQRNSFNRYEKS